MSLFRKYILSITGAITGALAGYGYYFFVGCSTGTCPITSNPLHSTLYGALLGILFFNLFKKENKST